MPWLSVYDKPEKKWKRKQLTLPDKSTKIQFLKMIEYGRVLGWVLDIDIDWSDSLCGEGLLNPVEAIL